MSPAVRRDRGVHYTPAPLARLIVELAVDALGAVPRSVCDPACGAGSLLLAAADAMAAAGVPPEEVVERRLAGVELDAEAAQVARSALVRWADEHGAGRPVVPDVRCADALGTVGLEGLRSAHDLVIGNPPFLDQLDRRSSRDADRRARVRERFGPVGPYCDDAALHLLAGLDLVRPGGVLAMVQPQSFLGARDTAAVRDRLLERCSLVSLWSSDEQHFDADVRVCVPVLRIDPAQREAEVGQRSSTVQIEWGLPARTSGRHDVPSIGSGWAQLLAGPSGVPAPTHARTAGRPAASATAAGGTAAGGTAAGITDRAPAATLSSVANVTAGFRDEYYALCSAMVDLDEPRVAGADPAVAAGPRMVTVGMIDPCALHWGSRPARIAGAPRGRPVLDPTQLLGASARVRSWVAARAVPKVLVATQSRVIEAAVDDTGATVPLTPVISVEPAPDVGEGIGVWHLAAALSAPPAVAEAVAARIGTGLSAGSVRWSASSIAQLRLPCERDSWDRGAELVRALSRHDVDRRVTLRSLGEVMCAAHRCSDAEVLEWWYQHVLTRELAAPVRDPA